MLRIQPTGNPTFDAAEVTAYQTYMQALSAAGVEDTGNPAAIVNLQLYEAGYLYACWLSAMQQYPADTGFQLAAASSNRITGAPSRPGAQYRGANALPVSYMAPALAGMIRARGQAAILPAGFFVARSATVASGGSTNMAVIGDILTGTTGATTAGSFLTAATFTVTAVDGGPLPTAVSVKNPGFYPISPVGALSTTVNTSAYTDATLTVVWEFLPTTYNS
jgi:hypothetical protein